MSLALYLARVRSSDLSDDSSFATAVGLTLRLPKIETGIDLREVPHKWQNGDNWGG